MELISKARPKCMATLLIQRFDLDITFNQMAQVALLHPIILHCPTQTIHMAGLICKPGSLQRSRGYLPFLMNLCLAVCPRKKQYGEKEREGDTKGLLQTNSVQGQQFAVDTHWEVSLSNNVRKPGSFQGDPGYRQWWTQGLLAELVTSSQTDRKSGMDWHAMDFELQHKGFVSSSGGFSDTRWWNLATQDTFTLFCKHCPAAMVWQACCTGETLVQTFLAIITLL